MFQKLSFALLFAVLTCGKIASATFGHEGDCPGVKVMEKFDWSNFLQGVWFEYAKYSNDSEKKIDCLQQTSSTINDNTFEVKYSGVDTSNQPVSSNATGKILGSGLFLLTTESGPVQNNKVLGTDYKTWAVIYNCENYMKMRYEGAWILTRERNPNEQTVNKAKGIMTQNGVSPDFLHNTRQNNCH